MVNIIYCSPVSRLPVIGLFSRSAIAQRNRLSIDAWNTAELLQVQGEQGGFPAGGIHTKYCANVTDIGPAECGKATYHPV